MELVELLGLGGDGEVKRCTQQLGETGQIERPYQDDSKQWECGAVLWGRWNEMVRTGDEEMTVPDQIRGDMKDMQEKRNHYGWACKIVFLTELMPEFHFVLGHFLSVIVPVIINNEMQCIINKWWKKLTFNENITRRFVPLFMPLKTINFFSFFFFFICIHLVFFLML